jgi:hypothetical protein
VTVGSATRQLRLAARLPITQAVLYAILIIALVLAFVVRDMLRRS